MISVPRTHVDKAEQIFDILLNSNLVQFNRGKLAIDGVTIPKSALGEIFKTLYHTRASAQSADAMPPYTNHVLRILKHDPQTPPLVTNPHLRQAIIRFPDWEPKFKEAWN